MKTEDVLNCNFSSWYSRFKKISAKSIVIPLPEGFFEYLLSDGVVLPDSSALCPVSHDSSSDSDDVDWSKADDESVEAPSFPDFDAKISESIKVLRGKVFPKLNWSAPKDASWIALNNSLQCTSVGDIYLLLKSSDLVIHDLTQPFKHCTDLQDAATSPSPIVYELILKKWIDIDPSMEFRCFVKESRLIAISQRDYTNFYQHIIQEEDNIVRDIHSFFKEHIENKFFSSSFVFDIYRSRKDWVNLIDFNPFGEVTDALLFDWPELLEMSNQAPELRFVKINNGVQPSPFVHGVPRDMLDLSRGEDPYKLMDLLSLREGRTIESSEDEFS